MIVTGKQLSGIISCTAMLPKLRRLIVDDGFATKEELPSTKLEICELVAEHYELMHTKYHDSGLTFEIELVRKDKVEEYNKLRNVIDYKTDDSIRLDLITIAVENVLSKYSPNNIDIVRDETDDRIDIMYHSRRQSFAIEYSVCSAENLSESDISQIAKTYNIGYQW